MSLMTLQQIFDTVATHLLAQGARSQRIVVRHDDDTTEGVTVCAYRGAEGQKCAIGCLILDEAYEPDLEGYTVAAAPVLARLQDAHVMPPTTPGYGDDPGVRLRRRLLFDLQGLHDSASVLAWPLELRLLAEDYGLSADVMNTAPRAAVFTSRPKPAATAEGA